MKVSKDTWIRTIVLFLTLLNQVLTVVGKNPLPFSEEALYQGISAVVTVVASLWAWWKNNSFTTHALKADAYLGQLKEEKQEEKK